MSDRVAEAAAALSRGELVLLPTETVYGLAADAGNAEAVARIFAAKGRPRFNPLIAHVDSVEAAARVGQMTPMAEALAARFWPGPLTLVLQALPDGPVCDLARAGLDSVAVRLPAHPLARAVIGASGGPVVAPSANRSGRPSPTTFADAVEETGPSAAVTLDGGDCEVGLESTVVSLLGDRPRLLRPGSVTRAGIEAVIGPLEADAGEGHRSPGRLTLHYAPDAPVRIEAADAAPGEILLGFGPGVGDPRWSLSPSGDLTEAAARLFRLLREADREHPTGIAVSPIPDTGLGEAINDRLRRAAGFVG
ncbi:L-threonylcarbamoyladenylate synthase [Brevundimonas halotolerans]|uniref:Threonylcarbamoyl-AMP synthase n=1 Tax=Brevundimonas halotolerans TaxID=69670 RepID=A0A7W9E5N6_9CAUL|nr:L-threonylcarbamoyladenylate synthase [Brevundimonas halotolerans]MBB5659542.1 L-threonylcarbamoyladenylate synthase [Brevundimonas halotolerans]